MGGWELTLYQKAAKIATEADKNRQENAENFEDFSNNTMEFHILQVLDY